MPSWRTTVVRVFTPRYVRDYEYFADTQTDRQTDRQTHTHTHTQTHTHTHNFTHSEQTEFVIMTCLPPDQLLVQWGVVLAWRGLDVDKPTVLAYAYCLDLDKPTPARVCLCTYLIRVFFKH